MRPFALLSESSLLVRVGLTLAIVASVTASSACAQRSASNKAPFSSATVGSVKKANPAVSSLHNEDSPESLGEPVHITSELLRRPVYDDISRKATSLRQEARQQAALKTGRPETQGNRKPEVGDEHLFKARSVLDQSQWRDVQARLAYRSPRLQIWIEVNEREDLASSGLLTPLLDSLVLRLEEKTPGGSVDPSKGILHLEREYVGQAPNVDGDERLDVLLFDIRDRFEQTGAYVAGFFDPVDLTRQKPSNRRDLLYVDTRPTLVREGGEMRVEGAAATIAHEYQHLIHARYEGERQERTFVNEGLSEVAEIICGFPPRPAGAYFRQPGRALFAWNYADPLPDYARASLFLHYLFERVGFDYVKGLVQSPEVGRAGIVELLREAGGPNFKTLFRDWGRALFRGADARRGYRHPARQNLRFSDFYAFDALPEAKNVYLPPLSHAPVRFPLTEELSLRAHGETEEAEIRFSGHATYPTSSGRYLNKLGSGTVRMIADAQAHGSIEMLASNVSSTSARPDSVRTGVASLLAEGERSGRRRVLRYDDGVPNPYSGSASYLLLDSTEAVGLAFGPKSKSWLYGVGVEALFLSEIEGSGVPPSVPREVTLRVRRLEDGRPCAAITPRITRVLRRSFGNPNMTLVSLQEHYDALAALRDSFVVTLRSASDENPLAVALDRTPKRVRAEAGRAFYSFDSRPWQPIAEVHAEGASLRGFRPMLRAHVAVQTTQAAPGALQADIELDLERVYVRLHAPFTLDAESTRLSARLPSGRLVDGLRREGGERGPFSNRDTTGIVFALPLEAGGGYELHARAEARGNELTAARGTFKWEPSVAGGFELGESYPNPVRGGHPAHLRLLLLEDAEVDAALFDVRGRRVARPVDGLALAQGTHRLRMDLDGLASGVYFARVTVRRARDGQRHAKIRKLVVVR